MIKLATEDIKKGENQKTYLNMSQWHLSIGCLGPSSPANQYPLEEGCFTAAHESLCGLAKWSLMKKPKKC